jgi:hypothetical protein
MIPLGVKADEPFLNIRIKNRITNMQSPGALVSKEQGGAKGIRVNTGAPGLMDAKKSLVSQ